MAGITADQISETLKEKFGDKILNIESPYDFLTITIKKESIIDVLAFLKNDPALDFNFLTTCCGLHFPDGAEKFAMMYQLHSMRNNFRLRLKSFTNEDPPVYPSLTGLFPTANWMEREAYDFFGFNFTGHPDLRRILNMDSLVGWPLRKEYPLEDPFREDKDDKMFGR
jgi:NADH-quinone oxidoreductase subunit C